MWISEVLTPTFWAVFAALSAFAGLLLGALDYWAKNPKYARHRIRPFVKNRYSDKKRIINTTLNQAYALLAFTFFFVYFGDKVFYNSWWPGLSTVVGETLLVLVIYDFVYYWYHRAAHYPPIMRHMHGTHHWVRNPTAGESSYLNPLEPTGALIILFATTWVVGPVSHLSWALVYFVYSASNLIVHSSLVPKHPALRLFSFWARNHDAHHQLFRVNYANIFPFWDQLFGTTEASLKKAQANK